MRSRAGLRKHTPSSIHLVLPWLVLSRATEGRILPKVSMPFHGSDTLYLSKCLCVDHNCNDATKYMCTLINHFVATNPKEQNSFPKLP